MNVSWAFESLLARLPDDDHLILELGVSDGFAFPRETGRVIIASPGYPKPATTSRKIIYVEGDVAHVPTVINAARLAVDVFGDRPILLLSVGGMDALDPLDAHELTELLIHDPGPYVGALVKTAHGPIWRFSGDPRGEGLVSMIRDYQPNRPLTHDFVIHDRHETWWLYIKPERNEDEDGQD